MKVILVLSLFVAAISAVPTPYKLHDDLKELFELLKFDSVLLQTRRELQHNGPLIEVVKYLQENWESEIQLIRKDPNYVPLKKLFDAKRININNVADTVAKHLKEAKLGKAQGNANLKSWLEALEKKVPLKSLLGFIARKELLSADWRELMRDLRAQSTHHLVNNILISKEYKGLEKLFEADGVDLKQALIIIYELLGWGKPPASDF